MLGKLIGAHPGDIAACDITFICDCLHEFISTSKNEKVLSGAFQCLSSLLSTQAFHEAGAVLLYVVDVNNVAKFSTFSSGWKLH